MTRRPRRNHSPAFKAKVALAAIRGEQTLVDVNGGVKTGHGAEQKSATAAPA